MNEETMSRKSDEAAEAKAEAKAVAEANKPILHGEVDRAAVAKLFHDLKAHADEVGFEIGAPTSFGRELEIHDPQSGEIITVARPHKRDVGQSPILLTPEQVVNAVIQVRHLKDAHMRAVA